MAPKSESDRVVRTSTDQCTSLACSSNYSVDNYQQYLAKKPFGYRCHANTGVKFPGV